MLPKIMKIQIIHLADHFLQLCVTNIRPYIKDTSDFLSMLEYVGPLPQGCTLETLDVASLTQIPQTYRVAKRLSIALQTTDRSTPNQ